MFGPPEDVKGECNARLYISDDYGDNFCTIRCKLELGHEGPHAEEFDYGNEGRPNPVTITWAADERVEGEG